jgi:hypothetical protein
LKFRAEAFAEVQLAACLPERQVRDFDLGMPFGDFERPNLIVGNTPPERVVPYGPFHRQKS